MVTMTTLTAAAAAAGVELEDRRNNGRALAVRNGTMPMEHEITLTAPDGQAFDGDVHERIIRYGKGRDERMRALATAQADIATLRACEIPDCEWCAGE